MLRDTLCVQILLKDYGRKRGLEVEQAFSHIIFYYGQSSIPKPFSLHQHCRAADRNTQAGSVCGQASPQIRKNILIVKKGR